VEKQIRQLSCVLQQESEGEGSLSVGCNHRTPRPSLEIVQIPQLYPCRFYLYLIFILIYMTRRLDCCAVLLLPLVGRWQQSAIWSLLFFSCFSSSLSPTTDQLTQTATTSLLYFSVTSSATSRFSHLDMAHWFFPSSSSSSSSPHEIFSFSYILYIRRDERQPNVVDVADS
jgi:hypothetical protein